MARLFIDIEARFAQVQDALNQITRNTERASKQMSSAFEGVKKSMALIGGGFSVGVFGRELVRATIDAEKSTARLEAVLRATGGTVGITRRELDELAESMESAFGIDDDEVRKAQATLIQFGNIQGDVFREGLKLSADLAASMGTDIASAAQVVGKALQSPTEGLRALEQQFGKLDPATEKFINDLARQGRAVEAQREVLRLFRDRVEDTARLMNTGLTKAVADVTNAWDGFLTALGKTEGPMRIVKDAFGGLALVLRTIKGLIETPPAESGLAPLAEEVKKIDKELVKLNARQVELNAKQSIGHAEAVERVKNEEEINRKLARRTQLIKEYNDLNDRITRERQAEDEAARAKQGTPVLGGDVKNKDTEGERAFKRTLEGLRDQLDKLKGVTVAEQVLRDIRRGAYGELDEAQKKQLLGVARQIDALRGQEEATKSFVASAEAAQDIAENMIFTWDEAGNRIAVLREAFGDLPSFTEHLAAQTKQANQAFIESAQLSQDAAEEMIYTWDRAGNRIEITRESFEELESQQKKNLEWANDLGFTFQSAFEDAILEGEKLSDVLKALEKDIARIILRMTVTKPLAEGIAGLIGEGLGGIFSGGGSELVQLGGPRALGGPVTAGTAHLVGERGPELFIPKSSGTVVPNSSLGGVTVNNGDIIINGSGVTAAEVRQALVASERRTIEAVRELNRR